MPEPTYRIKPLAWNGDIFGREFAATVPDALYMVYPFKGMWGWSLNDEDFPRDIGTKEEMLSAAEAHCRERLMVALEVVDE